MLPDRQLPRSTSSVTLSSHADAPSIQGIIDALPQAAVVINQHYVVCLANQKACAWGAQLGQLLLRPLHSKTHGGDDDLIAWHRQLSATLELVINDPQMHARIVTEHVFHGERLRYTWSCCENEAATQNGKVDRAVNSYVLLLVDAVAQPQLNDQHALQTHDQAHTLDSLRTFAAGIAHEFNNTFGVMSGSMSLLENNHTHTAAATTNEHAEILATLAQAIQRGHQLSDSILSFAAQNDCSFERVDLVQIVRDSVQIIKRSVPDAIRVVFDCNSEAAFIHAHPAHIHQVLLELTSNALYAIQHQEHAHRGSLQIGLHIDEQQATTAHAQHNNIRLWVQDNGCGIDPLRRDRIFDPFYSSKPSGHGRGMGLALVSSIIKKHQGVIEVSSQAQQGTCVSIYLPLLTSHMQSIDKRYCCLFVDDDSLIRTMTMRSLESYGCVCHCADSVASAIKILELGVYDFDAVITDWQMPGSNGAVLASYIQQHYPQLPVVLVSGFIEADDRQQLLTQFNAILDKPCNAKHIISCLDQLHDQNIPINPKPNPQY